MKKQRDMFFVFYFFLGGAPVGIVRGLFFFLPVFVHGCLFFFT